MSKTEKSSAQSQEKNIAMNFVLMHTRGTVPVAGVFAHHLAENLCDRKNARRKNFTAPDLVGLKGGLPKLADGEYDCTVYDVPAKLFYWIRNGVDRGLIVLKTDAAGLDFAKAKFEKRPSVI